MTEETRACFEQERARVIDFMRGEFELHGRSLVIFSSQPRALWQTFQLQVPVRTLAWFSERPLVSPLTAILDEHERYAVVLLDKEQARLLSVYLNRVEAQMHIRDDYPGRTATGGWAQARYARHREAHLHRHVLHVTEAIRAEVSRRPFDRLIVGGPDEALSALLSVLPAGLRSRVAGTYTCELFASEQEILDHVRAIEEAAERRGEAELVTRLVDQAKGGGLATLGWEQTLQSLGEGRVHKLFLTEGATRRGWGCPSGHFAGPTSRKVCPLCGIRIDAVPDLAEWAVERAFDTDASVETVRGEAARQLRKEGSVGALLRY